jgi:hypothetical protein
MTTTILTPEQLLASEPKRKDGLKTPFNKQGDRTIRFTWAVGDGESFGEPVKFLAELSVTHHAKGRGPAHYSATLWQMTDDGSGCVGTTIDGRNGYMILRDSNGAGRFSLNKLQGFAPYALEKLRELAANDPKILAYFLPERV